MCEDGVSQQSHKAEGDMKQDFDHGKAMDMLNSELKKMKKELHEVDQKKLDGPKKLMAKHMHEIYDECDELVHQFEESHSHDDFNKVCRHLEVFQPAFILNYNEILD